MLRYGELRIEIRLHIGIVVVPTEKFEKKTTFSFPSIDKKMLKIEAILYNWTPSDRMETGFPLTNRPKICLADTTHQSIPFTR